VILKDKTLINLNTNIDSLTKGSGKKVYVKCIQCNSERIKMFRDCTENNLCSHCNGVKAATHMGSVYGKAQQQQG